MAKLTPFPTGQELDNNGDPLSGGTVEFYEAGTSTPKTAYSSEDESVALANPFTLDSNGRGEIWLGSGAYKIVLKDSLGNTIDQRDDVVGVALGEAVSYDVTTNTTITSVYNNSRIYANGSLTLSLLAAADAGDGFEFIVKNIGSNDVIIDPDLSETIDDASTLTLKEGRSVRVMCDGDEWYTHGVAVSFQLSDDELEALAGVVSAANTIPYFTAPDTASLLDFKDEDDMSSDSATAVPSQQSVKAYVDNNQKVAQVVFTAISGGTSTSDIPDDNTTPTNTEGTEIYSQAITLASASSKVLIQSGFNLGMSGGQRAVASLFRGSTNIGTVVLRDGTSTMQTINFNILDEPSTAGSVTYSIRVGRGTAGGTVYYNQEHSGAKYNGAMALTGATLMEIT